MANQPSSPLPGERPPPSTRRTKGPNPTVPQRQRLVQNPPLPPPSSPTRCRVRLLEQEGLDSGGAKNFKN
ncbi:hypothetical protein RHMOL_Rhmol07G0085900 [Rhododendron molle]|uniref:Uncharacterized protein n=1 Tax=Rhododendron molle TaxID=49168 RepID=A0ACC0MZM8_RHOML|nr:hypothetical protein RHMOL_Rhmol07G0085900 [Rhododendron molle]